MVLQSRDIHEVVSNYLRSEDFEVLSCDRADLDGVSAGFLSCQDKARIKFRTSRGDSQLNVFMKFIPEAAYHRQNILTIGGFTREVILFNEVLNKYHEYLQDNSIPQCYLARSDELIVMEDMSEKGFKNKPLYETMDLHHCEKIIETLAKFHALSFITENRDGRKMTEIVPVISTEVFLPNEENVGKKAMLASINCVKRVAEVYLPDVPSEVMKKAFNFLDNLSEENKSSNLYPNVLSHSDMWSNNVMFRYDEQGSVADACIFDFQLATYKPPGYDIQFFLHACAETEIIERHWDHLVELYYRVLTRTLRTAGIDVQDLMSLEDVKNMLKVTLPAALAMVCTCLIYVMVPNRILKDVMSCDKRFKTYYEVDRTDHILEAMASDNDFNRRINQVVTSFVKCFNTDP